MHDSDEGNTLEIVDDTTAEAQAEFHRWALAMVMAEAQYGIHVLEVGTNKGMFGLLLMNINPSVTLYTIDINPQAKQAAEILEEFDLLTIFYCGDSAVLLKELKVSSAPAFHYAWVDGHHGEDEALSDLMGCDRLRIPWVAVDDTAYETVAAAIERWLAAAPYVEVPNPFLDHDSRQARLYRRKQKTRQGVRGQLLLSTKTTLSQ